MVHLPQLIADLGLILIAAAITTLLFKKLKQPVVLGYLIAGVLVGPYFHLFPTVTDRSSINIWAEMGVIFLLFSLGLEFSFKKLVKVGAPASVTAIVEVLGMLGLGYLTGQLLNWSTIDSIFLGGILSISSTTIIIRAFDELGVKNQKFASIVFGALIVEDLVAILLLVLLTTLAVSQQFASAEMLISLLKLLFFLSLWFLAGIFILPTFLKRAKSLLNDETLLILSLALCIMMVILATEVGFSPALGAFVMGSILAETNKGVRIEHLITSVKDLFGAIFFVSVGMLIDPSILLEYAWPIVIITFVTVFGKATTSAFGALLAGQPLKASVQTGLSLSQIGEFSFIIATLGLSLKVTSDFLYPIAVAVSAITTFTTPYLIRASPVISNFIETSLPPKTVRFLTRYSSGTQTITVETEWKKLLRSFLVLIITNSVIILAILLVFVRFIAPYVHAHMSDGLAGSIMVTITCVIAMAPFLWALSVKKINNHAYSNLWLDSKYNRGPLVLLEILRISLTLFFIGYIIQNQFSGQVAFIIAALIIVIVIAIFSSKLQQFYQRIENRFVSNLNQKNESEKMPLVPWDTHIGHFSLLPDSSFVGHRLIDLKLREKYGVNVATIRRGSRLINTPSREDFLYPGDMIAVIGTDEQLTQFKAALEASIIAPPESDHAPTQLLNFRVQQFSALHGMSIRQSQIREKTDGLIVGIERDALRITNPDSNEILEAGDLVYLVGLENLLKLFLDEMNTPRQSLARINH